MIDGEDDMIIRDRQQPDLLRFQPLRLLKRPTVWTMPILAWLVTELPLRTYIAQLQDSPQRWRATIQNVTHCLRLLIRKTVSAFVFANIFAENVSYVVFHPWLLR